MIKIIHSIHPRIPVQNVNIIWNVWSKKYPAHSHIFIGHLFGIQQLLHLVDSNSHVNCFERENAINLWEETNSLCSASTQKPRFPTLSSVADPEGVCSNPPPLEKKIFHFHGVFSEKSGKITNIHVQLTNQTPLCKFEPAIKKSWIRRGV